MKQLVVAILFAAVALCGCARNHFNIPAENFAEKVKVLGVAPILIDEDSDINFPQKELLIPLISDLNRKYDPLIVRKLQSTGNFYAVAPLPDEPRQLFNSLMARREKRDDANIQYNKYFWKSAELDNYIKSNRLDAVMIIVVSGLTNTAKIYSSNLMTSLETDFNFLTMTAQILSPDGTILWEYPNFRERLLSYYPLVNLQYPDFSESEANMSKKTAVRFKTIDGIRRTLEQKKNDWLFRETQEPEVYGKLFDEMTSLIKNSVAKQPKDTATVDGKPLPPTHGATKPDDGMSKPAPTGPPPAAAATPPPKPVAKAPVQISSPKTVAAPAGIPATESNEIVPATESTR